MPAKGSLTSAQKENLQKVLQESDIPRLRERILMFLLRNDSKTYQEISEFLSCAYRSVAYWCVHGDSKKLETLRDGPEKGNYHKASEEYIQVLMEAIEKEPRELGYEFGRWSANRLATYLAQKTKIKLSGEQVRRILRQKKYVYLWAKYSLEDKQDPNTSKAFKQKLKAYLTTTRSAPEQLQL